MILFDLLEKKSSNNAILATVNIIKHLNVPVTYSSISETLESHPSFPSLLSISDCLNKFNISNISLHVDPIKLTELPTPFIAHTRKCSGNFMLVTSVNQRVTYLDQKGKLVIGEKTDFLRKWDNIVLIAKKDALSLDPNYKSGKNLDSF